MRAKKLELLFHAKTEHITKKGCHRQGARAINREERSTTGTGKHTVDMSPIQKRAKSRKTDQGEGEGDWCTNPVGGCGGEGRPGQEGCAQRQRTGEERGKMKARGTGPRAPPLEESESGLPAAGP